MRRSGFLMLGLFFVLSACAGQDQPRSTARKAVTPDIRAWNGEMPIVDAWLRDQLPDSVLAYVRIPHPLGLMAVPKGNMLDTALGSEVNISNLVGMQQALAATVTESFGPEAGPALQLLVDKLQSPVEVSGAAMPAPWVMIGMTLAIDSNVELETLLNQISQTTPLPSLLAPLDGSGYGQFQIEQPVFLHFDSRSGQLALFGGLAANLETFQTLLESPASATEHPMRSLEAEIDSSGQGYFAWVNTTAALAMAPLFAPPDLQQLMRTANVDQIHALAIGAGVANGKGRMKLIADVGTDRTRRPWPVVENTLDATSVGDPRGVFLFSIPSPQEFARIESLVLSMLPQAAGGWSNVKSTITAKIGVSIEELLGSIGPELISFSDQAGEFSGLKVRNPALLDDVLDRLAASAGVPIEQRNVAGQSIHYVSLPGNLGMPGLAGAGQAAGSLELLGRLKNRLYWVQDDGYLYMTSVPQTLIDRARLGADTSIAGWLRDTQRIDLSSAMLAATGTVANLPRKTYQMYVSMMQTLADLFGADYDIWAMPTPLELGLPERGSLSASINLGEPRISLELAYESHPAEVLFGAGGLAGVAAAGVVAAIALPAYQDYTIRAQVTEGLNLAAAPKTAVVETYLSTGEVPAAPDAAGLGPEGTGISGRYVESVDIIDGQIEIHYGRQSHAQLRGRTLVLTPYEMNQNGNVIWACGNAAPPPGAEAIGGTTAGPTDVASKYLPSACRPNMPARVPMPVPTGEPIAAAF